MASREKHELDAICQIIAGTVGAEQIYLFGSYAYGEPNQDSDYDLYVVVPDDGPRPTAAVKAIRKALYDTQLIPLDVIVCRAGEFQRRRQGASLERKIAREGVLLHGKQLSVEQGMV